MKARKAAVERSPESYITGDLSAPDLNSNSVGYPFTFYSSSAEQHTHTHTKTSHESVRVASAYEGACASVVGHRKANAAVRSN